MNQVNTDRSDAPTRQDEINQQEWANPDNWGRFPLILPIYFSKRDSRLLVPLGPFGNKALNLGHRFGFLPAMLFVLWSMAIIFGVGWQAGSRAARRPQQPVEATQQSPPIAVPE